MTGFDFGDIVLVSFPFTDQVGTKKRPAVVVSSPAYNERRPDIVIMAVTGSFKSSRGFGELMIGDWRGAGLIKPSVVKPVITTIEKRLVNKVLGRLDQGDRKALEEIVGVILRRRP